MAYLQNLCTSYQVRQRWSILSPWDRDGRCLDILVDASFSFSLGLGWSIKISRNRDGRYKFLGKGMVELHLSVCLALQLRIPVNFFCRFRNTDERVQGKKHQCVLDPYGSYLFCRIRIYFAGSGFILPDPDLTIIV